MPALHYQPPNTWLIGIACVQKMALKCVSDKDKSNGELVNSLKIPTPKNGVALDLYARQHLAKMCIEGHTAETPLPPIRDSPYSLSIYTVYHEHGQIDTLIRTSHLGLTFCNGVFSFINAIPHPT